MCVICGCRGAFFFQFFRRAFVHRLARVRVCAPKVLSTTQSAREYAARNGLCRHEGRRDHRSRRTLHDELGRSAGARSLAGRWRPISPRHYCGFWLSPHQIEFDPHLATRAWLRFLGQKSCPRRDTARRRASPRVRPWQDQGAVQPPFRLNVCDALAMAGSVKSHGFPSHGRTLASASRRQQDGIFADARRRPRAEDIFFFYGASGGRRGRAAGSLPQKRHLLPFAA